MPGFDGQSTARVLQQAQSLGLQTSLDVCWDPNGRWAADLLPCLPHCDLIFPNETEAQAITGKTDPVAMAQWFLDHGTKTAVIKLGADGCLVKNSAGEVRVPGFAVHAVDATGAGDAFAGGFLAGLVWRWDWARTARFACALAAISVTDFGVTTALTSKEQVLALMES
ncbi:MAG: carbohydrate kinase family protein [Caldilineaceae bacterium]